MFIFQTFVSIALHKKEEKVSAKCQVGRPHLSSTLLCAAAEKSKKWQGLESEGQALVNMHV
jgi:hypothetical protein